jgi:hypothetical protein
MQLLSEKEVRHMTIEAIMKSATELLIREGCHAPTILLDGTNQAGVIVLAEFPSENTERIQLMYKMGQQAVHERSVGVLRQVFLVSESWMGTRQSLDDITKKGYIRPSLDPHRMEVLTVTCLNTSTQEHTIGILEIIRNSQDEIVELKKVAVGDGKGESSLLPAFVAGYQST